MGHLAGQKVHSQGRQAREAGGEQNADISNVDGDSEEAQDVVDNATGHHKTGVQCATSDTAQGMPGS